MRKRDTGEINTPIQFDKTVKSHRVCDIVHEWTGTFWATSISSTVHGGGKRRAFTAESVFLETLIKHDAEMRALEQLGEQVLSDLNRLAS